MPLFGKSQKNPVEVVKQIKEAVVALEKGDKKLEKVSYGEINFLFILIIAFLLLSRIIINLLMCVSNVK